MRMKINPYAPFILPAFVIDAPDMDAGMMAAAAVAVEVAAVQRGERPPLSREEIELALMDFDVEVVAWNLDLAEA